MPGKTFCDAPICDEIEAALKVDHPDSVISIHIEPEAKREHGAMTIGSAV